MSKSPKHSRRSQSIWWAIVGSVPLLAMVIYFEFRGTVGLRNDRDPQTVSARDRLVAVGGVERPTSDLQNDWASQRSAPGADQYVIDPAAKLVFGHIPTQKPDANLSVASAHEAMKAGQNPERLSPLVLSASFNRETYQANPETYLAIHEPGRVFQSAQPGPDVPALLPEGAKAHVVRQGETVRLQVRTEPNMPATFTSFDIGLFANGLTSISVAANDQGIAEATYFAAPGKVGEVNILAASPVASEQVKFDIWILAPKSPKTL